MKAHPNLLAFVGAVGVVIMCTAGIVFVANDSTSVEPPAPKPKATVDMPAGYPDVIMNCLGANGVYTNLKGQLFVVQSDVNCDPPVVEVPR